MPLLEPVNVANPRTRNRAGVQMNSFSFDLYREICENILRTGRLCDYRDVLDGRAAEKDGFVILRHDVEFSPERAELLAVVEAELEVSSSFFFQVTNNAYNSFSRANLTKMKKMSEMGHHIGLHFHLNGITDANLIERRVRYEASVLSEYLGFEIDRFSFHRPTEGVLRSRMVIDGLINAYSPEFFTFCSDASTLNEVDVKYVADSQNAWQYIDPYPYPTQEFFDRFQKVQILCHPYSWTKDGYGTLDNLKTLVAEKKSEFVETLESETKYVKGFTHEL